MFVLNAKDRRTDTFLVASPGREFVQSSINQLLIVKFC